MITPLYILLKAAVLRIRLRQESQTTPNYCGEIEVLMGADDRDKWIEVSDNGTELTIADIIELEAECEAAFVRYGAVHNDPYCWEAEGCSWDSHHHLGRFGSLIRWAKRVHIATRDRVVTYQFMNTLVEEPLIMDILNDKSGVADGTQIKIWWKSEAFYQSFLESSSINGSEEDKLAEIIKCTAPCLDVQVSIVDSTKRQKRVVIYSNDWLALGSEILSERIHRTLFDYVDKSKIKPVVQHLRPKWSILSDDAGISVGRGALWKTDLAPSFDGLLTMDGFASHTLQGFWGFLKATSDADTLIPSISRSAFVRWIENERDKRLQEGHSDDILYCIAQVIRALRVDVSSLPIARNSKGWITSAYIANLAKSYREFLLLDCDDLSDRKGTDALLNLEPNMLVVDTGAPVFVYARTLNHFLSDSGGEMSPTLEGAVIEALARGWDRPVEYVLECSELSDPSYPTHIRIRQNPCVANCNVSVIRVARK